MTGSAGVMALVLAETVAGTAALLWCSPLWREVKRGYFTLNGVILTIVAFAAWRAADAGAIVGDDAGTWSVRLALASYPGAKEVVWVQEESKNMGAWTFLSPLLEEVLPAGTVLRYTGRAPSAAVATGNAGVHKRELAALLAEALGR